VTGSVFQMEVSATQSVDRQRMPKMEDRLPWMFHALFVSQALGMRLLQLV